LIEDVKVVLIFTPCCSEHSTLPGDCGGLYVARKYKQGQAVAEIWLAHHIGKEVSSPNQHPTTATLSSDSESKSKLNADLTENVSPGSNLKLNLVSDPTAAAACSVSGFGSSSGSGSASGCEVGYGIGSVADAKTSTAGIGTEFCEVGPFAHVFSVAASAAALGSSGAESESTRSNPIPVTAFSGANVNAAGGSTDTGSGLGAGPYTRGTEMYGIPLTRSLRYVASYADKMVHRDEIDRRVEELVLFRQRVNGQTRVNNLEPWRPEVVDLDQCQPDEETERQGPDPWNQVTPDSELEGDAQ